MWRRGRTKQPTNLFLPLVAVEQESRREKNGDAEANAEADVERKVWGSSSGGRRAYHYNRHR